MTDEWTSMGCRIDDDDDDDDDDDEDGDEDDEDDHVQEPRHALSKVIKGMLESLSTVDVNSLKHLEATLFGALCL